MDLQTVCRGRTLGHLLLRLCRSKANPPPDGSAGVWQCGYRTVPANHGRHAPNPKGRTGYPIAKSTCTGVCNDILPFATLSRRGAQYAPGQRKIIRGVGEHSDSLRAAYGGCSLDAHCGGCVRPYGLAGADGFTNGVPRSYLRAPSLAALPQQSESTTGRVGRRVAVRL